MTHSLHRRGEKEDLRDDYVMLIMPGMDRLKHEIVREGMREIWDILARHEASLTNYGTIRGGGRHRKPIDEFKKTNSMMIHAVFANKETFRACLKEIKDRDLGISVSVSGCNEYVKEACAEVGLTPHTVQYSLGIHGKTEQLPEDGVLDIATMCGHAMVSPNLISHVVERIEKGKMTHGEGAARLSGMCDCGIFNAQRAERLLRQIA